MANNGELKRCSAPAEGLLYWQNPWCPATLSSTPNPSLLYSIDCHICIHLLWLPPALLTTYSVSSGNFIDVHIFNPYINHPSYTMCMCTTLFIAVLVGVIIMILGQTYQNDCNIGKLTIGKHLWVFLLYLMEDKDNTVSICCHLPG